MLRKAVVGAGALLVLFHVWLLAGQAWDGRLADPAVVLRWLVAGGVVAAFVGVRRQGGSIFRGRRAVAIWLLAALVHGPAIARQTDGLSPALPEAAATLAQIVVASASAIGLGLLVVRSRARRQPPPFSRTKLLAVDRDPAGPWSAGTFVVLAPRPPPA